MKLFVSVLLFVFGALSAMGQSTSWIISKNLAAANQHNPISMAPSKFRDANYIAGYYNSMTLNSGLPLQSGPVFGFLTKIDANGDTLWTWKNTANFTNVGAGFYPRSIAVDRNDNVVMVGFYNMPTASATITVGTTNLSNSPFYGGTFMARFDSSGNVLSVQSYSGYAFFNDVDLDSAGNIYIIGNTQMAYTFGSYTIPAPTSLSGGGNTKDFLLCTNSSGTVLWAKPLGELDMANPQLAAGNEGGQHRIAVTKNNPVRVFTSGFFFYSYTFTGASFTSAGKEDALVLKFDQNGNYMTGQQAGAANFDAFYDIQVNKNRKVMVAGMYRTSTTINNINFGVTAPYCQNVLVAFDSALSYNWVDSMGLGCGNYPHIGMDDYNRVCLVTGANGSGNNFLYFYDQNGSRTYTQTYSFQNTGYFPGMGAIAVSFPPVSPGKLYFVGAFKPVVTIGNTTISASTSYCSDLVIGKFDVPIPCKPSLGPDTGFCNSFSTTLQAGVQGSYLWSTNDTTATIQVTQPGTYWVRVTQPGCVASDTVIIVRDTTTPSFTPLTDTTLCNMGLLTLNKPATNARSFKWWNNSTSSSTSVLNYIIYPWIDYKNYCGTVRDSMTITRLQKAVLNLGPDTTLCAYQQIQFNAGNPNGYKYKWSTNDTTKTITASNAGTYWVDVSNYCGTVRDSVLISTLPNPTVQLGADTFICGNTSITLSSNTNNASTLLWNTNTAASSIQVNQPGIYVLTASNRCGSKSDSINVIRYNIPQVHITGNNYLCSGTQTTLTAQANEKIHWSTSDTSLNININTPGKYWVNSANVCGVVSDTLLVAPRSKPTPALGNDTVICTSFVLVNLKANTAADYYKWSTNAQGANMVGIVANAPGWFWLDASNVCGTKRDSILIEKSALPVVNIGQDTMIRSPFSITLNAGNAGSKYRWSRSAADTLQLFTTSAPGTYWVDVTNRCGTRRDSILISTNTGISNIRQSGIRVYPNPAVNMAYIANPGNLDISEISILDMTSKEVLLLKDPPAGKIVAVPLTELKDGVYSVIIRHSEGTFSTRLAVFK